MWGCLMQEEVGKCFSVFSFCFPEETTPYFAIPIRPLALSRRYVVFKKHCGQFLDRFHVHNQGIIYSKNTVLVIWTEWERNGRSSSINVDALGKIILRLKWLRRKFYYIFATVLLFLLFNETLSHNLCSFKKHISKSYFIPLLSSLFHFYHVSYLQFMCPPYIILQDNWVFLLIRMLFWILFILQGIFTSFTTIQMSTVFSLPKPEN